MVKQSEEDEGTWLYLGIALFLFFLRWLIQSDSRLAVKWRRNIKSWQLHWRRKLGYRDASVYQGGKAGQGASAHVKRQG